MPYVKAHLLFLLFHFKIGELSLADNGFSEKGSTKETTWVGMNL